jgi:hypothetical protein
MFAIQASQTRLALALSVTLDNRENFCARDKYSQPGRLLDQNRKIPTKGG